MKSIAPSGRRKMPLVDDEENVHHPTMDLEEGSGDSENEYVAYNTSVSGGGTDDLDDMTSGTTPSDSGNVGKKKRGEGSNTSKKQKHSSLEQIADAISVIANASKDRIKILKEICNDDAPIRQVVPELLAIEEIATDEDFCVRCCDIMMHKTCRETFVALKGNKKVLLEWLRFQAYNAPELQKPPNR